MENKCQFCNTNLIQKTKEPNICFQKRKFCNNTCKGMFMRQYNECDVFRECKHCKLVKNKSDFITRKNRPGGIGYICKSCQNEKIKSRKFDPTMIGMKICKRCSIEQDINNFFIRRNNKDGRYSICKVCENNRKLKLIHSNVNIRLTENLRRRMRAVLSGKNKSKSSLELIGCSSEDLISYIESKFIYGMNWENYGEWHIDHIKPCASFDLTKEEEQKVCFHYTNLQPLWAKDNLKKADKYVD